MAIYFVSLDMRSVQHDYGPFYARLRALDAHQAQSTAWLIESPLPLQELSDDLRAYLDPGDGLFLIVMTAGTGWAATHAEHDTGLWLKQRRP
jgi:hypothetical protein